MEVDLFLIDFLSTIVCRVTRQDKDRNKEMIFALDVGRIGSRRTSACKVSKQ